MFEPLRCTGVGVSDQRPASLPDGSMTEEIGELLKTVYAREQLAQSGVMPFSAIMRWQQQLKRKVDRVRAWRNENRACVDARNNLLDLRRQQVEGFAHHCSNGLVRCALPKRRRMFDQRRHFRAAKQISYLFQSRTENRRPRFRRLAQNHRWTRAHDSKYGAVVHGLHPQEYCAEVAHPPGRISVAGLDPAQQVGSATVGFAQLIAAAKMLEEPGQPQMAFILLTVDCDQTGDQIIEFCFKQMEVTQTAGISQTSVQIVERQLEMLSGGIGVPFESPKIGLGKGRFHP